MRKNRFALKIGALLTVFALFFNVCVFGEEEFDEGEAKASVVEQVVEYLNVYSRYDELTQANIYKNALLDIIKEKPELYEDILKNMLENVDEYSEYFPPAETKEFVEDVLGEIVGIGITFQVCPEGADIVSVIDNTPASEAGLCAGDIIVSADGVSFEGMNSNQIVEYVRGPEGSSVRIEVKHSGEEQTVFYDIVRQKITEASVVTDVIEKDGIKVKYIGVSGFLSNTADCFINELEAARADGIKNIIIDLRSNGGGSFDQSIKMADYFLPEGSVITKEDHKIEMFNVQYLAEKKVVPDFNTIILVNEYTASASEVFTAALSENGKAYVIGERTFGKGTIQSVVDLPFNDSMKYTIAYYLTPKGNNIHKIGIEPDLHVENPEESVDMSKYPPFSYTRKYELGDTSDEVKTAKELLQLWGTYNGEINDEYDKEAETAVYKFQSQMGLYAYGVLDYSTQQELYARISKLKFITDKQLDEALNCFGITNSDK